MAKPVAILPLIEQVGVLNLLGDSIFDEVLGYVAFERAEERLAGVQATRLNCLTMSGILHRFMLF